MLSLTHKFPLCKGGKRGISDSTTGVRGDLGRFNKHNGIRGGF